MDKASPNVDIKQLRLRAKVLGISIRARRASQAKPVPAYDLIDSASGRVLYARLSLADVELSLARTQERCSSCGTPRLATFRWCRSCGGDFEPFKAAPPSIDPRARTQRSRSRRFCESCGEDQGLVPGGGALTRAPDGEYLCSGCADRLAADERPSAASRPSPPLPTTIEIGRSATRRRRLPGWIPVGAVLGISALVIAMQQPAFRQSPASDGGVLGAIATAERPSGEPQGSMPRPSGQGDSAASPSPSSSANRATPVAGEAVVRVDRGTARIWTGPYGEVRIQVIVPVRNSGTDWVALPRSASTYRVVDGHGRELASGLFTAALPGIIGPNQTGYLVETVSAVFSAGRGTPTVETEVAAVPVARPTASLSVTDLRASTAADEGLRLTGVVHNEGPATTGWLVAGGVLIDATRRPMAAVYDPGRVGPLRPGASAAFDTAYPGAAPAPDEGFSIIGVAFEALGPVGD
jgi:hypothetical protein